MNSQSINALKCLAVGEDGVQFLISILAQGMGVAIARFVFCDSLQKNGRKKWQVTRFLYLICYKCKTSSLFETKKITWVLRYEVVDKYLELQILLRPSSG